MKCGIFFCVLMVAAVNGDPDTQLEFQDSDGSCTIVKTGSALTSSCSLAGYATTLSANDLQAEINVIKGRLDTLESTTPPPGPIASVATNCAEQKNNAGSAYTVGIYTFVVSGVEFTTYCDATGRTLLNLANNDLNTAQSLLVTNYNFEQWSNTGYGNPDFTDRFYWAPLAAWKALADTSPANTITYVNSINQEVTMEDVSFSGSSFALSCGSCTGGGILCDACTAGVGFTTHDHDADSWYQNCATDNVGNLGGNFFTACHQSSQHHTDGTLWSYVDNADSGVQWHNIWFMPTVTGPPAPVAVAKPYSTCGTYKADADAGNVAYVVGEHRLSVGGIEYNTYCDSEGKTLLNLASDSPTAAQQKVIRTSDFAAWSTEGYGSPSLSDGFYFLRLDVWQAIMATHPVNNLLYTNSNNQEIRISNLHLVGTSYDLDCGSCTGGGILCDACTAGTGFTTHDHDADSWYQNCATDNVGDLGGNFFTACHQSSQIHSDGTLWSWVDNASNGVQWHQIWFKDSIPEPPVTYEDQTAYSDCSAYKASAGNAYTVGTKTFRISGIDYNTYCDSTGRTLLNLAKKSYTSAQIATIQDSPFTVWAHDGYGQPDLSQNFFFAPLTVWQALAAQGPSTVEYSNSISQSITINDISLVGSSFTMHCGSCTGGGILCDACTANVGFTTFDHDADSWYQNCASDNVGDLGGNFFTACHQSSQHHSDGTLWSWVDNANSGVDFHSIWFMPIPTYSSCREINEANPNASDGTYTIVLSDSSDLEVYCDMSGAGGWTLLANQQQTSNNCQSGAVGTFTSLTQSSSYRLSDDQIADIQGSGDGHFRYSEPGYNSCSGDGECTDSVYWKYDAGVGTKNHDFHSNTGTSGFNKNGNLHHCSTKLNGDYYGEDGGTCYRYANGSNDDGTGANNGLCGYTSHYGLDTWATGGPHNGHCGMYFIWCYGSELYRDGAASSTAGHLWVR